MCREFATRDEDQRVVPPGRLPLPRAHAGHPREPREERRAAERCGLPRACSRRQRRGASCPSSTSTASRPPATTPTTAWSSRGPSCGATRRPRRSSASRSSRFTRSSASRRAARASTACACARAARRASRASAPSTRHPHAQGRQRRGRLVARGRAAPRRRASQQAPPPRDLLHRAAQAVAQAPRRRPRQTASTSRSRRAARSSAASATSTSPPGSTRRAATPSSASTRARSCARARSSGSVKVLRQWAGCYDLTPDANPIVGPVDEVEQLLPGQRLHGARLHDGARRRQAHGPGRSPAGPPAPLLRPLEPAALRGGKAPLRGDDHRLTRGTAADAPCLRRPSGRGCKNPGEIAMKTARIGGLHSSLVGSSSAARERRRAARSSLGRRGARRLRRRERPEDLGEAARRPGAARQRHQAPRRSSTRTG